MRLASTDEFLEWAAGAGVEALPQEPEAGEDAGSGETTQPVPLHLGFRSGCEEYRYWSTPYEPKQLLVFVTAMLDALESWEACWAVKSLGIWDDMGEGEGMAPVLRMIGIPEGFDGALRFEASERTLLAFLMVTQIAFGWCSYYNIWVAPDHGRQMIGTEDDDITLAFFSEERLVGPYVERMAAAGFALPEQPPDEGFRWEPWMGPEPEGWGKWRNKPGVYVVEE